MENFKAILMDEAAVLRALKRISHEIVERNNGCENLYIVGIKRRGAPLAKMIAENIGQIENCVVPTDTIDITFYRDDTERHITDPIIKDSQLSFDVFRKKIVLVDDVLYTGRTVRAAMEAIMNHGRPSSIQLAVLVDRGHRELPIRGDYVGKNVPTSKNERIVVKIPPIDQEIAVALYD